MLRGKITRSDLPHIVGAHGTGSVRGEGIEPTNSYESGS